MYWSQCLYVRPGFFVSSFSSSFPGLAHHGRHQWFTVLGCGGLWLWFSTDWDHCDRVFWLSLTMPSFSSPDSTLHLMSLPLYSTHLQLVLWTAISNHWIKSDFYFVCIFLCVSLWSLISVMISCVWFNVLERFVSYALYWFMYCSMQKIAF